MLRVVLFLLVAAFAYVAVDAAHSKDGEAKKPVITAEQAGDNEDEDSDIDDDDED